MDDLHEPGIELQVRSQALKAGNNSFRLRLDVEHLQTLMIETINGIFIPPMIATLVEQRLQFLDSYSDRLYEIRFIDPLLHLKLFPCLLPAFRRGACQLLDQFLTDHG